MRSIVIVVAMAGSMLPGCGGDVHCTGDSADVCGTGTTPTRTTSTTSTTTTSTTSTTTSTTTDTGDAGDGSDASDGSQGVCPTVEPVDGSACSAAGLACNDWGSLSCPETATCGAGGTWRITCPATPFGDDAGACGCAHPGG